jgi:hypothetical protein
MENDELPILMPELINIIVSYICVTAMGLVKCRGVCRKWNEAVGFILEDKLEELIKKLLSRKIHWKVVMVWGMLMDRNTLKHFIKHELYRPMMDKLDKKMRALTTGRVGVVTFEYIGIIDGKPNTIEGCFEKISDKSQVFYTWNVVLRADDVDVEYIDGPNGWVDNDGVFIVFEKSDEIFFSAGKVLHDLTREYMRLRQKWNKRFGCLPLPMNKIVVG